MIKSDPRGVWAEYQRGVEYNNSIDLYETVRVNRNFYLGRQWEGLNAPDLPKPVMNVMKRVVSYQTSMTRRRSRTCTATQSATHP